jgi:hypothetical protein
LDLKTTIFVSSLRVVCGDATHGTQITFTAPPEHLVGFHLCPRERFPFFVEHAAGNGCCPWKSEKQIGQFLPRYKHEASAGISGLFLAVPKRHIAVTRGS